MVLVGNPKTGLFLGYISHSPCPLYSTNDSTDVPGPSPTLCSVSIGVDGVQRTMLFIFGWSMKREKDRQKEGKKEGGGKKE